MQQRALLVVDVQPTFCEGGELAVSGGNLLAHNIARFLDQHAEDYDCIFSSQDWHIDPGAHFSDQPDFVDSWPPHGLADSENAQLHPAIQDFPFTARVKKGHYQAAYSAFEGRTKEGVTLAQLLAANKIKSLDLVGIALSHCVKDSALSAVKLGLQVRVFTDLTIPVSPELGQSACQCLADQQVQLVCSPLSTL